MLVIENDSRRGVHKRGSHYGYPEQSNEADPKPIPARGPTADDLVVHGSFPRSGRSDLDLRMFTRLGRGDIVVSAYFRGGDSSRILRLEHVRISAASR